jgi:hypothetical protein
MDIPTSRCIHLACTSTTVWAEDQSAGMVLQSVSNHGRNKVWECGPIALLLHSRTEPDITVRLLYTTPGILLASGCIMCKPSHYLSILNRNLMWCPSNKHMRLETPHPILLECFHGRIRHDQSCPSIGCSIEVSLSGARAIFKSAEQQGTTSAIISPFFSFIPTFSQTIANAFSAKYF